MEKKLKMAVVGGGSWGTAVANYLAMNCGSITLWVREDELVEQINIYRENRIFLPEIKLSSRIEASSEIIKTVQNSQLIFLAVPSQFLRSVLLKISRVDNLAKKVFVNLAKGIEVCSLKTCSQVAVEVLSADIEKRWLTLSGPSFARELALGFPTAVVLASKNQTLAEQIQNLLSSSILRLYTTTDLIGVEIAGSVKNVIAIASGLVTGCGFGYNTKAALITRAMIEITRLGFAFGACKETFWGLAGIGDLMLTCFGELSRNFQYGFRLAAENQNIKESFGQMVVEGVETTRAVIELARKFSIELPICEQVYKIIFEQVPVKDAINTLMSRSLKAEWSIN